MYTLIFEKESKLILQTRLDVSTGIKMTLQEILDHFCKDNAVNKETIEIVETTAKDTQVIIGKHAYNKSNDSIEVHSAWREPPRLAESGIPTTDLSNNQTTEE